MLQEVANGTFAAADHANQGVVPIDAFKISIDEYCYSAEDIKVVSIQTKQITKFEPNLPPFFN